MWTVTNEATGEVTSVEMMGAHAHASRISETAGATVRNAEGKFMYTLAPWQINEDKYKGNR